MKNKTKKDQKRMGRKIMRDKSTTLMTIYARQVLNKIQHFNSVRQESLVGTKGLWALEINQTSESQNPLLGFYQNIIVTAE